MRPRTILWPLAGLILAVAAVPSNAQDIPYGKKKYRKDGASEWKGEVGDTRGGLGLIPLGARARGHIVQGFYNCISFEAVAGTRVTIEINARHDSATLLGELRPPLRDGSSVKFENPDGDPLRLLLSDHELPVTGIYTVRFGFEADENAPYRLTTSAVYPETLDKVLLLKPLGRKKVKIDGMQDRRIDELSIDMIEGMEIEAELLDPHGFEVDLKGHVTRHDFGRRIVISNVVIESIGQYTLVLHELSGTSGRVTVETRFKNPPLSKRSFRI